MLCKIIELRQKPQSLSNTRPWTLVYTYCIMDLKSSKVSDAYL